MKSKQYSVKIYEVSITDEVAFMEFFNNNYTLFKDHLIVIKGDFSATIKDYLEKKKLAYLHNVILPKGRNRKALEEELKAEHRDIAVSAQMAQNEVERLSSRLHNNLTVLDEMIRSGREIDIQGDLLLLNRVNSGATIKTTGNLIITKVVEGSIRCLGNFMMLTASPKANIVFNGVEVDNNLLENRLNRVELKNNEIIITPVLKKEINWAL